MVSRALLLCVAVVTVAEGKKGKEWKCEDVTAISNPTCFGNITWAMETGIVNNASWYPPSTLTRADFQCALFLKVGKPEGEGHSCVLPPCTPPTDNMTSKGNPALVKSVHDNCYDNWAEFRTPKKWKCEDYTNITNPECFGHVTWAMETGIVENASWYPFKTTTRADFQCALFMKKGKTPGESHGCALPPCTPPTEDMTSKGGADFLKSVKANCFGPEEEEASFPWWGYVLVSLGVLTLVVIGVLVFMQKPKPKKKKRALKPVETKAEPLPTYKPVVFAAAPPVVTTMVAPPQYVRPASFVIQQ